MSDDRRTNGGMGCAIVFIVVALNIVSWVTASRLRDLNDRVEWLEARVKLLVKDAEKLEKQR